MYIKSANVFGFGKLVDQKFDFSENYQIIRGFNESGKTTLLSFIKSVLFGFENGKNKYEQYIPKNASQYGGELTIIDGDSEWLIRRVKGSMVAGAVTVYKDGTEFPESALNNLLKTVSKDLFNEIYVLNQDNIGKVSKLSRDQLITEVLTVGAVGGTEWLDLMKKLDKSSGDVYRKSANAKRPLNIALKEYDQLIEQRGAYQNQKVEFEEKNKQVQILETEIAELNSQKNTLNKSLSKQQSIINKKSEYDEYLNLNQILDSENIKTISNSDWDKFRVVHEKIKSTKSNLSDSQSSILKLSDDEEALLNNYSMNQAKIEEIHSDLDEINHKEFNVEQLQADIENNSHEKNNLLSANNRLSDNMTPLNPDELVVVNAAAKQNIIKNNSNNLYIALAGVVIALVGLFLPGAMKIVSLLGIGMAGWFFYRQSQNSKIPSSSLTDEYLVKHNYRDLTLGEAITWQPQISQLQNISNKLNQLNDNFREEKRNLDSWKKSVDVLNIVNEVNVKNVNSYFEQLNYLQKKQKDIQQSENVVAEKNKELSQEVDNLTQQQMNILEQYNVKSVDEFTSKRATDLQFQDQIKRRDVLKESLDEDLLEKISKDPSEFDRIISATIKTSDRVNSLDHVLNEKNEGLARFKVEIDNLTSDDEYLRLEKDISDKQSEIIELYDDWASKKLGASWIYDTLNLASSNRFPKMLDRTVKYFNILTNENYVDVEFGDKLIKVQSSDSQKFELLELSRGTIAQLFISLRCAFVMEISDLVKLPILIDDAFNEFDRNRYEAAVNLVKKMSEENQIIYVTTNNISVDYFGANHIIDLGGKND